MSIHETFEPVNNESNVRNIRPLTPVLATVLERHIVRHGFKCKIEGGFMLIYIPYYDSNMKKSGEKIFRVSSMVEAYKAMGY